MTNFKTYAIPTNHQFIQQGGAVLAGFIATRERSEDILVSVSGWQPSGGEHPTIVLTHRHNQGGEDGIWFRINFVRDKANGTTWLTFYQGGNPQWGVPEETAVGIGAPPWH